MAATLACFKRLTMDDASNTEECTTDGVSTGYKCLVDLQANSED